MERLITRWVWAAVLSIGVLGMNGCLPLAAGAAAGYIARDQGYKVQSPLKKTGD